MEGSVTHLISGVEGEDCDLEGQRAEPAACEGEDAQEQTCQALVKTDVFLESPLEEKATV